MVAIKDPSKVTLPRIPQTDVLWIPAENDVQIFETYIQTADSYP